MGHEPLAEAAAHARIEEVAARSAKEAARTAWALGDYHAFARQTVWEVGEVLVEACGIEPGQRVLDVAAGSGNVALRAAEAGAEVIASDLAPEHFVAGRKEAASLGVELEWVEADAEALPFDDGAFDVVTSSFGAMFAPDQERVADELVRVCRPGGTIGLASFTPEGLGGDFFGLVAEHAPPPPPGAASPLRWGSDAGVRELLGGRVASLELTRTSYVERAATPQAYSDLFRMNFGPLIALRESLGVRAAELDRALAEFAERANRGEPGRPAEYPYEYLLVVARTRAR